MDSVFFRLLTGEIIPRLIGRRLEKVYGPAPDICTLGFGGRGDKFYLIIRYGRKNGHFFISPHAPPNPKEPSARTMWLRKRAADRRVLDAKADIAGRRLLLTLSPARDKGVGELLLIDLQSPPTILDRLPDGEAFGVEPQWPEIVQVLDDPEVWREYPAVSPGLRRTLAGLAARSLDLAATFYADVRANRLKQYFVLYGPSGDGLGGQGVPEGVTAFPSAERLADPVRCRAFESAEAAARAFGEPDVFAQVQSLAGAEESAALKARRRKLGKNLAAARNDLARLADLAAGTIKGEALKAVLHTVAPDSRLAVIQAPFPDGVTREIRLDPRLSVSGNMARFFRLAEKGVRGRSFVEARVQTLEKELAGLEAPLIPTPGPMPSGKRAVASRKGAAGSAGGALPRLDKYKGVAVKIFRTTDGFVVLRGRNAKANHKLLTQIAGAYDFWLHVAGGPGAHVILRRDNPAQEPPAASLEQAAVLAALSSYRAADSKAEVVLALVRDVRTIKGADMGLVTVDKVRATLHVAVDHGLEESLAVETPA